MRQKIAHFPPSLAWLFGFLHPSWHLYAMFWGIITGFIICQLTQKFWFSAEIWLVVVFLVAMLTLKISSRIFILAMFLAGFVLANVRIAPDLLSKTYLAQITGREVVISGLISEDPDQSEGKISLRLDQLSIDPSQSLSGTLYVQLAGSTSDLERSDRITLKGQLNPGFGTFVGLMYRPEIIAIERASHGDIFARLKNNFADTVRKYVPRPAVDLGLGYLMGMKNGLSKDFSETLRLVGMTHVVVASGAHLGILVNLTKKLFGRFSRFAELLFALLTIFAFVLIVGFTPSMMRAGLVTSFSLLAGYVGRRFTPLRLLTFVATLTLLYNPTFLVNLGWQLSFASFFGLLILQPKIQHKLYGGKQPPWLANMLLTSFATSLMCAPILAYNYGIVSLLSFVANLIILPTLPYAMLLIFLTGLTSLLPFVASFFGQLATHLLDFHIYIVNLLSERTMFIFELPTQDLRVFVVYFLILFCLVMPKIYRSFSAKFSSPTRSAVKESAL